MQYTRKTENYNARRYGRPWIAEVSLTSKDFSFGEFEGRNGEAGKLYIKAGNSVPNRLTPVMEVK